jgi:diadenosine tetraphosphate (Ap4A) HIT family hydrolase
MNVPYLLNAGWIIEHRRNERIMEYEAGPCLSCPLCCLSGYQSRCVDIRPNLHDLRAVYDLSPVSEGHTLVFARDQHVDSLFDLNEETQRSIWEFVRKVRFELQKEYHPDGFTIGVDDGVASGQTVKHAYIHVIPRRRGDVADPTGGIRSIFCR